MAKRRAPSRVRYEADHPNLTVRVPAAVKAKIQAAAQAEGLSVSAWVQALVAGHAADAAAAYERGRADGYAAGHTAGFRQGREEGEQAGRWGGWAAGLLEADFLAARGKAVDPGAVAQYLAQHPEQRAVVEAMLRERGYAAALREFGRRMGGRRA